MADPVALNNVTARLHHFEPIKIAQGFARPRQGILNRFLNALGRGADELDDAINVIFHHSPFINYGRTSIFALGFVTASRMACPLLGGPVQKWGSRPAGREGAEQTLTY